MGLSDEQLQRVLKDRSYWITIAAGIIREAQAHAGSTGSGFGSSSRTPNRMEPSVEPLHPIVVKASDLRERVLRENARLQKQRTLQQLEKAGIPVRWDDDKIPGSLDIGEQRKLGLRRSRKGTTITE